MSNYTREDIIRLVEEEDVEFIRLQFVDIYGTLKNMAVTTSQLEKVLNNKCMFDGAAVDSFTDDKMVELYLAPRLNSFAIFPWRPQHGKVARFMCDILNPDGTPFVGDSRAVLNKVVEEAKDMGVSLEVGPECEFFLFDADENGMATTETTEKGGYFDIGPLDQGENARREMVLFLEEMGFVVETSFHAYDAAQHIIGFECDEALVTADNIATFKLVVRTVAKRHGLHATFMPKPKRDADGSAMRLHIALIKEGKNVFTDMNDPSHISQDAYYFMAGIMEHMDSMMLVTNPIINSYKRLVSGSNAPFKPICSINDRGALLRVCSGGDSGTRLVFKNPDGAANPYLVLAVYLAAGLDGMRRKLKAPEFDKEEEKAVPTTLIEAVRAFEKDAFIRKVLGDYITDRFIADKKAEWNEYLKEVSDWEVKTYLNRI